MNWINTSEFTLARVVGAALQDAPALLAQLATTDGWLRAKNRIETLVPDPHGGAGWRCDFEWSSALHACRVFPPLGALLMRRAFQHWPVRLTDTSQAAGGERPAITFLIPFRGTARLPQLLATVRSILGQQGVRVECLVIEQSNESQARQVLPPGARYHHLPHPGGDAGWRKSWAYNVGAALAASDVLVCHDGDILVPQGYAHALLQTLGRGFDSVHIQRFLFYLGPKDSQRVQQTGQLDGCCPDEVRHNWVGGTLAITRDAYFEIGGFDEGFVDWGGEDNEFFSRCSTLRQCRHGFVPFVHLWHPPQVNKSGPGRDAAVALMNARLSIPALRRIQELRATLASKAVLPGDRQGTLAPGR